MVEHRTRLLSNLLLAFVSVLIIATQAQAVPQIMFVGDSTTKGQGSTDDMGFRSKIQDAYGLTTYDEVGRNAQPSTGFEPYDNNYAGGSGATSAGLLAKFDDPLDGGYELTQFDSPVISGSHLTLHVGINDVNTAVAQATTIANIQGILDAVDSDRPGIMKCICTVIPRSDDVNDNNTTTALNTALVAAMQTRQETDNFLKIVDLNQAFLDYGDWSADLMNDGVHPNDAGYQVMADTLMNQCINPTSAQVGSAVLGYINF